MKITATLDKLRDTFIQREKDSVHRVFGANWLEEVCANDFYLKISIPEPIDLGILMIDGRTRRSPSPMLKERYEYCGDWNESGQLCLAAPSTAKVIQKSKEFKSIFKSQKDHWGNSAPALISSDRLSLLGASSLEDGDVSYLVWKEHVEEPEVWIYNSQNEQKFDSLLDYLNWLLN